jgi:hypothetical protein
MCELPTALARALGSECRKLERAASILACVARLIENGRPVDVVAPIRLARLIIANAVDRFDAILRETNVK